MKKQVSFAQRAKQDFATYFSPGEAVHRYPPAARGIDDPIENGPPQAPYGSDMVREIGKHTLRIQQERAQTQREAERYHADFKKTPSYQNAKQAAKFAAAMPAATYWSTQKKGGFLQHEYAIGGTQKWYSTVSYYRRKFEKKCGELGISHREGWERHRRSKAGDTTAMSHVERLYQEGRRNTGRG